MSDEGAFIFTDIPRPWPLIRDDYIVSWLSRQERYNFVASQAHVQICDAFIYQPQNLSDTYYYLLWLLHRPSRDLHPPPAQNNEGHEQWGALRLRRDGDVGGPPFHRL